MKKCNGCGIVLQDQHQDDPGYTPKSENDLCQRCFRLNNYNDLVKSYKNDFDNFDILNAVNENDRLILWVVDLFDFDSNIIDGLNRHLLDKDIILIGTKRDLLPASMGNQKLLQFVQSRLKFYGISVKEILFTGNHGRDGFENVLEVIDYYRNDRDVIIMGQANAGKSSLINTLANSNITISKYPGTTLDLIAIDMDEYTLYDTPGLIRDDNLQVYVDDEDLKAVVPQKIVQKVFQLERDTSFTIEGLIQIQFEVKSKTSVIFYVNDRLKIHRTSIANAEKQWARESVDEANIKTHGEHKFIKQMPIGKDNFDIVINGLGFVNVKKGIKNVAIMSNEKVAVLIRKALI